MRDQVPFDLFAPPSACTPPIGAEKTAKHHPHEWRVQSPRALCGTAMPVNDSRVALRSLCALAAMEGSRHASQAFRGS